MRTDSAAFAAANRKTAKSPRFVVEIEYDDDSIYLSSHSDIDGVPGDGSGGLLTEAGSALTTEADIALESVDATHIVGCLVEPSIASQKLNPDQGRAEIGAASFTIADIDDEFTAALKERNSFGQGLRDRTCRFYLGYSDLDFSDFQLVGTQIVKSASFDRGAYRIACNDIQRSARKEIFDLAQTTLAQTAEATDTTLYVSSTAGFEPVKHGASYTDAPSSTVYYVKVKDEIIRATGKTANSFTGCARGVLGTQAARYQVDGGTPASRREKLSEYVYLEVPGPKLLYAILTGVLYGDGATLPTKWHLGIPTDLVRVDDFTGIGADLWDTSSDAKGIVLRFEGIGKTDGKAFYETEICRLMGLFTPVYADGMLGLRRMTRVLADASGVLTLDESNSVQVDALEHDMEALHNAFRVLWNWNGKDYTRTTVYVDAESAEKHGPSSTMELKFRGLFGGIHTDSLIFRTLDSIRDRYSAPPLRMNVSVFHALNTIEVGDVVRVKYQSVRDYTGTAESIDRAFEVQGVTVNHRTGAVSLDLFGSTSRASIIAPTESTVSLPDAFYTAAGTNLTSVMTISSGVVSGGPYTLTGGTSLLNSVWYHDGDLTIPSGVTVNLAGNVQLRIKGYLTINGTLTGIGGGWAGVADNGTTTVIAGNPGWVGNSRGHDGVGRIDLSDDGAKLRTQPAAVTQSRHASFPVLNIEVSGNNLNGLPSDIRGTGGGPGGKVLHALNGTFYKNGGTGGNGGAGLCTISRGLGLGANSVVNLSGSNTSAPTAHTWNQGGKSVNAFPGAGGAGGPGSWLLLIDGSLLSVPDLAGRFTARTGSLGVPVYETALDGSEFQKFKLNQEPFAGYLGQPSVITNLDLSFSASRIQYIPEPETAVEDVETVPPVTALSVTPGTSGFTVSFTGSGPAGTVYEVWRHTSSTPFSAATKVGEGATNNFFIARTDTTTVYIWVRAKYVNSSGKVVFSDTTPTTTGLPVAAGGTSGTYAVASSNAISAQTSSTSITTGSVTASLVGATATTFSWTRVAGSSSITANSASAATTTFSATGVTSELEATFRCTINSTYTVDVSVSVTNVTSALSVAVSNASVTKTENAASVTTATVTATATGGAGGTTFAWTRISGSSGISATAASSATTAFSATSLSASEIRTATFRVTATDSASSTATKDVSVTITRAGVSVAISPTGIFKSGSTSTLTTASVTAIGSNGSTPYVYAWTKVSGDTITATATTSATTAFTASGLAVDESRSATFRVTVTDNVASTATADIVVTITRFSFL